MRIAGKSVPTNVSARRRSAIPWHRVLTFAGHVALKARDDSDEAVTAR